MGKVKPTNRTNGTSNLPPTQVDVENLATNESLFNGRNITQINNSVKLIPTCGVTEIDLQTRLASAQEFNKNFPNLVQQYYKENKDKAEAFKGVLKELYSSKIVTFKQGEHSFALPTEILSEENKKKHLSLCKAINDYTVNVPVKIDSNDIDGLKNEGIVESGKIVTMRDWDPIEGKEIERNESEITLVNSFDARLIRCPGKIIELLKIVINNMTKVVKLEKDIIEVERAYQETEKKQKQQGIDDSIFTGNFDAFDTSSIDLLNIDF